MKIVKIVLISQILTACVLTPPIENRRKSHPAMNDLDNIEMLVLEDHQSIYEGNRKVASDDPVRLGMQKTKVQLHMGQPTFVEVAGNPKYGNERWIYERSIPTMDGYYTEKKVIYFEAGSVVGWESH